MLDGQWQGMTWPRDALKDADARSPDTGVRKEVLEEVGKASVAVPEGFVRIVPFVRSSVMR